MKKISTELENTRKTFSFFSRLKRNSPIDNGLWNEIEEALIQADVGVTATSRMIDVLQMKSKELRLSTSESILNLLKEQLKNSLQKFNTELRKIMFEPLRVCGDNFSLFAWLYR